MQRLVGDCGFVLKYSRELEGMNFALDCGEQPDNWILSSKFYVELQHFFREKLTEECFSPQRPKLRS